MPNDAGQAWRRTYIGVRSGAGPVVLVIDEDRGVELLCNPCRPGKTAACEHEWGYGGSGPGQLAFSLVCDLVGQDIAATVYRKLKTSLVATLPHEMWVLHEVDLWRAIYMIRPELRANWDEG